MRHKTVLMPRSTYTSIMLAQINSIPLCAVNKKRNAHYFNNVLKIVCNQHKTPMCISVCLHNFIHLRMNTVMCSIFEKDYLNIYGIYGDMLITLYIRKLATTSICQPDESKAAKNVECHIVDCRKCCATCFNLDTFVFQNNDCYCILLMFLH